MSLGPAAPWKCGNVDVKMKMKTFDEGAAASNFGKYYDFCNNTIKQYNLV